MTFSIVAYDPTTGQFAASVSSSSPSVAARCAYTRAGVGAATTQNVTDPRLGPLILDTLAKGKTATEALEEVMKTASFPQYRQVTVVDNKGNTAIWSGEKALGANGKAEGPNVASAGNLLATEEVPKAVVDAFTKSKAATLGDKVLEAMQAGLDAGGEAGPVKSAGLEISEKEAWPLADIRVDWSDKPIADVAEIWELWKPQMHDYVTRCLNPDAAPSYGVPGDE